MARFRWTEEKVELLRQYYPNTPWEELYQIIGNNSKDSIVSMASKYNISRDIYNKCHFSPEEQQFIIDNSHQLDVGTIAKHLNRTNGAITQWAQKYGVYYFFNHGLRPEDISRFKQLYPFYTNKYLCEKEFPYLTKGQLRTQARKFNLVKDQNKGVKWYDREVLLDELKQVCIRLGRTPMLTEFQTNGLPSETTFRRYFGGITQALEELGLNRNSYAVNMRGQSIDRDLAGNVCFSHSEIQIGNFLLEQGFHFEKEFCYNNLIPKEECGQKRFDWKVGNKFIEYFGLSNREDYKRKMQDKQRLCQKYNIDLLAIFPQDMYSDKWQYKILKFLNE